MDLTKPVLLNQKLRGTIILCYLIFAVSIITAKHPIISIVPILIGIFFIIIMGFIVNMLKYFCVVIHNKWFLKRSMKDIIMQNVENCSICLDDIEPGAYGTQLTCKHIFHNECIMGWYKQHQTCPLCRKEIGRNNPV